MGTSEVFPFGKSQTKEKDILLGRRVGAKFQNTWDAVLACLLSTLSRSEIYSLEPPEARETE